MNSIDNKVSGVDLERMAEAKKGNFYARIRLYERAAKSYSREGNTTGETHCELEALRLRCLTAGFYS